MLMKHLVVKALGICLRNRGNDSRRPSADRTFSSKSDVSGTGTPKSSHVPANAGKAKEMSKNLLGSARKIRARLQPALTKEARTGDRNNYLRLQFLDQTLEGMIKRFEDEFPETRLASTLTSPPLPETLPQSSPVESLDLSTGAGSAEVEPSFVETAISEDEGAEGADGGIRPVLSRHNSDVSLASRALSQEEGRMHRFGQKFRRDMLKPEGEDLLHGTTGEEKHPIHLQMLRAMVEGLAGEEIRTKIETEGQEAVLSELANEASAWRQELIDQDPENWKKFTDSMEVARRNTEVAGTQSYCSAIE